MLDRGRSKDCPWSGRPLPRARVERAPPAAWLPKEKGIAALAEYAALQRAHVVFLPESLDSMDELRPLLPSSGDAADVTRPAIEIHVVSTPTEDVRPPATGNAGPDPR